MAERRGGSVEPKDVHLVGVVGAGVMGSGIVEVVVRAGAEVVFVEASSELVRRGRERIERSLGTAVDRGKVEGAEAQAALGRVRGEVGLGALADSDLVI
ncbi:MAG: 3-hydroxyacyl-CoA dehydrogenase NAD-binding domain-containing protein, partial [Actinomycetota bacterium]|nr:3-hydroxyacyl-CoA dehydrogenase NAD-binding domain-containing protein [Actinomycetota bacterium]